MNKIVKTVVCGVAVAMLAGCAPSQKSSPVSQGEPAAAHTAKQPPPPNAESFAVRYNGANDKDYGFIVHSTAAAQENLKFMLDMPKDSEIGQRLYQLTRRGGEHVVDLVIEDEKNHFVCKYMGQ